MQKKEWQRNLLIGCIVAALFFGWWLRGFLFNWRFRLFSRKSWAYVANELETGWQPSSTSDWIFMMTLLFAVPVFLYLWYLCAKIKWRKLFKTIWKGIVWLYKKIKKWVTKLWRKIFGKGTSSKSVVLAPPPPPSLPEKNAASSARPKPVAHSSGMTNFFQAATSTAPAETARPTFNEQKTTPVSTEQVKAPVDTPWNVSEPPLRFEDQPLDEIQLPQRDPVVEDIPGLFKKAGYYLIEDVSVSNFALNYVAICADRIYAVLMDREPGDWLAEEEPFNGEAPLWFSEIDHRVSPVYELRQCVEELHKKIEKQLPDFPVKAFMIEEKGNIINAEEMMRVWRELNVVVARTDVGGMEDLPTATEVISPTTPASASDIEVLTKLIKGE